MSLRASIEKRAGQFSGTIEFQAPLSKSVCYRIGGPAEALVTPRTFGDLDWIHGILQETGARFFILGWGSNLLFGDEGFPGLVIRMKHLFTEVEEVDDGILKIGGSLGASSLLRIASERGYGGLSHLTGIPGSVGGMVAMNAGTHLGEIGAGLIRTEFVNLLEGSSSLKVQTRIHESGDFSYRRNHFLKPGDLMTHTWIRFRKEDPSQVKREIEELYQRRKATQPVDLPSCGSVFMNPRESGLHAWQVVEKLGLKGVRIGNAQISEKHGNFIVNLGGATASDVCALIDRVKADASRTLGIELHEEVKIIR